MYLDNVYKLFDVIDVQIDQSCLFFLFSHDNDTYLPAVESLLLS